MGIPLRRSNLQLSNLQPLTSLRRSPPQNHHSTPKLDHSLQNTLPFDTPMLPFPMFRPRTTSPSLVLPAESPRPSFSSFQNLRTFQLSNLPTFPRAIPFRIRTYEKHTPKPFGIRTSKTQGLKSFRMNTYEKRGRGAHPASKLVSKDCRGVKMTIDSDHPGRRELYPLYFHGTPQSRARVTRVTDAEPGLL